MPRPGTNNPNNPIYRALLTDDKIIQPGMKTGVDGRKF